MTGHYFSTALLVRARPFSAESSKFGAGTCIMGAPLTRVRSNTPSSCRRQHLRLCIALRRASCPAPANDNDVCHRTVAKGSQSERLTLLANAPMGNKYTRLTRQMFYQALVLVTLGISVFVFVAVLPLVLR